VFSENLLTVTDFLSKINSTTLQLNIYSYQDPKAPIPFSFDWTAKDIKGKAALVLQLNFSDPLLVSREVSDHLLMKLKGNSLPENYILGAHAL
jgi:hypothetical protein